MGELLDDLLGRFDELPEEEMAAVREDVISATSHMKWVPNPGPQTEAYFSEADVLLYGGEPGGGKSQLLLGLAFNEHRRTIVMRREYGDLERIIEDALAIHGSRTGFNGSPPPRLKINAEQTINFRAAQRVGDEQGTMGQGRDLLAIDEATHFAESQIRFMMGWVRSEVEGQRCRTVLATNPPLSAEGLWVNVMFAPWLDPKFPNPAKPGELRWVITDENGDDQWVEGPGLYDTVVAGVEKKVQATSRTYIPASVSDNPYYAGTDYEDRLAAMPEPYRSLLMGGFQTAFQDQDFQVIPTDWVTQAQERWTSRAPHGAAMTCMAVDPAGGGQDAQEMVCRYGGWFSEITTVVGKETADGNKAAAKIFELRRDDCPVVVDVGGGYGGQIVMRMGDNGVHAVGFNGSEGSERKTKDGQLRFYNKRADSFWGLREELDPSQEGGSVIALPPDPELLADLTALTWKLTPRGIQIEGKDKLRQRLGRSTGKGDVVAMALSEGDRAVQRAQLTRNRPRVLLGHQNAKRRRR